MPKKFDFRKIENEITMQKLFKKKAGIKKKTREEYIYTMVSFCNLTGKSPTEILDIHKKELLDRVPEFNQWLSGALDEYVTWMIKDKDYSYNTINNNITNIKGFLHSFRARPTPQVEIPKKRVKEDAKYALKVEDIRSAIRHSPPVYQTLFITMAQTGLAISDALSLDVADFVRAVSDKNENLTIKEAITKVKDNKELFGCFDMRRTKTNSEFYTFAGPETLKQMAMLLERRDEELLYPDSPIFMKDTSKIPKKFMKNASKDLRLTKHSVEMFTGRLHSQKGIFPRIVVDNKERNYFRTHKLRKWFANQVKHRGRLKMEDVKYLMGQKTGDVVEDYYDTNNYEALKTDYLRAYEHLGINDTVIIDINEDKLDKLGEQIKEKEKRIKKLENAVIQQYEPYHEHIQNQENKIKTLKSKNDELTDKLDGKIDEAMDERIELQNDIIKLLTDKNMKYSDSELKERANKFRHLLKI